MIQRHYPIRTKLILTGDFCKTPTIMYIVKQMSEEIEQPERAGAA